MFMRYARVVSADAGARGLLMDALPAVDDVAEAG